MSLKISDALEDGFFAERVLNTIKDKKKNDEAKLELLQLVIDYINKIEEGKLRKSGKLVPDPVESLVAYRKALDIIASLPCDEVINEIHIKKILEGVKLEVQMAIDNRIINPRDLKKTYEYFKGAKELAIREITTESMKRKESSDWPAPMLF